MMGGGHCANSLAKTITSLNWNHSVTDSRQEYCDELSFPKATELMHSSVSKFLSSETHQSIRRFSDVLLLGHDWSEDQERLLGLLRLCQKHKSSLDGINFPRIGVIGSRSKWQAFAKAAEHEGIEVKLLDQVICPIGINIGAESPEEIAIAVTAQILALSKGVSPGDKNWRDSD
tara:strand:- start:193 stop:714 length:522 start_codon:yes stop_codon:yes gene_type:complete